ncbi:hypothetical protein AQJ23_00090 [Streptomyces antibioticus]|nr:hypothetical protein AQJ23_00090 [Streptomyces antibioticus]
MVQAVIVAAAATWSVWVVLQLHIFGLRWLAVPIAVLVGLWTAESIRSNGRLLQRQDVTWDQSLMALSVGFVAACSVLWAVTTGMYWHDRPANVYWSALGLAVPLLVTFGMTIAVTRTFPQPSTTGGGTNYGAVAGVLQDQGMISLLVFVVVWIPALLLAHVPEKVSERWLQIPQIAFSFMLLFTAIFCWILRYNSRHAAFRRHHLVNPDDPWPDREKYRMIYWKKVPNALRGAVRRGGPKSDEEWVDALENHTTLQNLIAITIVFVCVIGWIPLAMEFKVPEPK